MLRLCRKCERVQGVTYWLSRPTKLEVCLASGGSSRSPAQSAALATQMKLGRKEGDTLVICRFLSVVDALRSVLYFFVRAEKIAKHLYNVVIKI